MGPYGVNISKCFSVLEYLQPNSCYRFLMVVPIKCTFFWNFEILSLAKVIKKFIFYIILSMEFIISISLKKAHRTLKWTKILALWIHVIHVRYT